MYYVIESKAIINKIKDWIELSQKRKELAFNIAKKYGSEEICLTDTYLYGIGFPKKPNKNWVKVEGYSNVYRPHGKLKDAENIRKDFDSIDKLNPTFEVFSTDNFAYGTYHSRHTNRVSFYPGLREAKDGKFLLHTPDFAIDYMPPKGIKEITFTEYKRLKK